MLGESVVQLHYEFERVREVVSRSRDELGDYWGYLVGFYEDLLSDPGVTSATTVFNHVIKVRMFLRWLRSRGVRPEEVSISDMKEYVRGLVARLKPGALQSHIKSLRRFVRYVGRDDLLEVLRYPKQRVRPYELPDPELVERIIAEVERMDYRLILALLYETGMRVSEVLALKGKHVEEAPEGYYRVYVEDAKNGEFRVVFVIKYARLMRDYLAWRKPGPNDWLFPSPSRPGKPLHPHNVETLLKRLGKKYGVRLHPHLLRHLRGTLLVKEGVQERVVMKILGHKTERMLRIYVNLVAKDVEEVLLTKYGIAKQSNERRQVLKCPRCGAENPPGARYCWRCGLPLSAEAAEEKERRKEELQKAIEELKKILKERPELLSKLLT